MSATKEVALDDLFKILDTIQRAHEFHVKRDEMNAAGHLARQVRYSPLTAELEATWVRLLDLCGVANPDAPAAKRGS